LKRISTMFLALCLLSSGSAYAAGISVNNSRGYATTLDIECPKVNVSETSVLGAKALEITAPEASLSSDKDLPTLPRYTAMVMVDPSRRPVFQVNSLESEIITVDARIVPSKGNFTRNINPSTILAKHTATINGIRLMKISLKWANLSSSVKFVALT